MSASATVHSIPYGSVIGHQFDAHLPKSYCVVEVKSCEGCCANFFRPRSTHRPVVLSNAASRDMFESLHLQGSETKTIYRDEGERFCKNCRTRMLLPPELTQEREAYQNEMKSVVPNLSKHLIRYDNTLLNPTRRRKISDWKAKLTEAFISRGPLSTREIVEITGHHLIENYSAIIQIIRIAGFRVVVVGSVWPRKSCMGSAPKLYWLESLSI
jgi:hypothetical protein